MGLIASSQKEGGSLQVIIQTFNPQHYVIQKAKTGDFIGFWKEEMSFRQELYYPPFARLVNLRIRGKEGVMIQKYLQNLSELCSLLQNKDEAYKKDIEILGPAPAFWEKLRGEYRFKMLIKGPKGKLLHSFISMLLSQKGLKKKGIKLSVDVDSLNIL